MRIAVRSLRASIAAALTLVASAAAAADRPLFRLGDAAAPFGWSTIVADFNTDGQPDVAIADHVARHAAGYTYRLAFEISGEPDRDVTFESRHAAIAIRLADVDRDRDLDLVAGVPISGETVAVWLNDGHGHFTGGDVAPPSTIQPLASFDARDRDARTIAVESSDPRVDRIATAAAATLHVPARQTFLLPGRSAFQSSSRSSATAPRAPPAL